MKKKRVLVCDDDEALLDVCQIILSETYIVHTLKGCDNILESVEALNPDIILMDIIMPGGGENAVTQIKKNEKTSHIPVVRFSAKNNLQEIKEKVDATAVIAKPFDIQTLRKTLKKYVL